VILCCDDDADVLDSMRMILEANGYAMVSARSAEEGLKAYKASRPDLVIVDRHALGVRGELEWALHALREERPNATIVLGLREVLDAPEAAAREWERLGDPTTSSCSTTPSGSTATRRCTTR